MTHEKPHLDTSFFQDSIQRIVQFYDLQIDLQGVFDSTPIEKHSLHHINLKDICESIGLSVQKVKCSLEQITHLNAPAILDLDNKICTYIPSISGDGQFIVSNKQSEPPTIETIAQGYKGFCYVVKHKDQDSTIDISHMKKGHALDWFWNPLVSFWDRYAEIVLATCFINILALAIPLYTLNVYDRVVVNFVEDTLVFLTIGVITAIIFDFLFKTLRAHIIERIAVKISGEYDVKLMDRMLNIKDVDLHLSTGEKSNLFRELHGIRDFYASRLVPTLVDLPFFLLFTFIIYLLAAPLAIIPIVAATIIIIINLLAQPLVSRHTAQYFTAMQSKSAHLIEMLNGLSTIKTLGATGNKLFKWQQIADNSAKASCYNTMISQTVANLSALTTQIAQVSIVFFGAYLIYDASLTVGGLVACSIIYGRSIAPIVTMASVLSRLKQSNDVLKTIDKIFQLPNDNERITEKSAKGPFKGDIKIRDLTYQYPDQAHPALYKINLDIKAGEHIGLIGKTGAGKSTLSDILVGMINPNEGKTYLDSFTYDSIADTELKRSVGYVPQNGHFFNGSMQDNITMGHDNISQEDLERAIHMSGLDLVMSQTAEGLDMNVGESGKRLSGGQKQALSLARAFVRNPQILIFDEPTTGMDNALEARVTNSIKTFIKDKTFIMITHRTSLLPLVSRLILLDQGRIIADGGRDDILKKLSKR